MHDAGVEALGDRRAAVIVTVWTHGDEVVGRVTPVRANGRRVELGRAYRSVEEICAAACDLIREFAAGTPSS